MQLLFLVTKLFTYFFLFTLFFFSYDVKAQYLCDYEYKVINKQKRKVKKKCKKLAEEWLTTNRDSLNLPTKLKLSKIKFRTEEKETHKNTRYNKWHEIDSLLCVKKDAEYVKKAKERLLALQLVVYDIRAEFNFIPTANEKILSVLNFEFDIQGNLIRAVIRRKKTSPFSETPLH